MKRIAVISLMLAASLAACKQSNDGMGPARQAGKAIDQASVKVTDKVGQKVEEAGQKMRQDAK